ncbi:MAG: Lrp/AsnC family transcriptional regulator [Pseudochelatococcus sp.]|jgi:DNA-binding Lrp family transcriptional regulator|uniref:Lrp/AsnC family transcriptional regulator n=1 Tax=Pseudochelatococcus sp. TaxID=2020869 RepID=UPI003D91505F
MARRADTLKDQELLNILKQNARLPLAEIANQLGVSRATIQARLTRLERDGYIKGYTIVSGHDTGDVESLSAIILVEIDIKSQSKLISDLKKIPEVMSCHTLSGQFDLLIKIQCRLPSELDELIDRVAHMDGVRRTTSSILLMRKFER